MHLLQIVALGQATVFPLSFQQPKMGIFYPPPTRPRLIAKTQARMVKAA